MMFPVNLCVRDLPVLLIGGGRVGLRKLGRLLAAGARVRLVEPAPGPDVKTLIEEGRVEWFAQFTPDLLGSVRLVFVATPNAAFNAEAARAALEGGAWVNVADRPDLSTFFLPAVVENGDFQLTVSTGGHSPALAARLADQLRATYGPAYGRLTALLGRVRGLAFSAGLPPGERRALFRRLADSEELLELMAAGNGPGAYRTLRGLIAPLALPDAFPPLDELV